MVEHNEKTYEEAVDEAVESATQEPTELSEKQKAKEAKKNEAFWNSMITRKEAFAMMNEGLNNMSTALDAQNEKINIFLIQAKTFERLLINKGIVIDINELDKLSVEVMDELFGSNPVEEAKGNMSEEDLEAREQAEGEEKAMYNNSDEV